MTAHHIGSYGPAMQYEIRVAGHLDAHWTTSLGALSLRLEDDGTTVLRGSVVDQAALHGLLQRLRDVGIPLISLTPVQPEPSTEADPPPHDERN